MAHKAKVIVEVIPPKDIITGNPDAPVTLVEFGDYESEACAKANEIVKQLMEKYEDKMNFTDADLSAFNESRRSGSSCVSGRQVLAHA